MKIIHNILDSSSKCNFSVVEKGGKLV